MSNQNKFTEMLNTIKGEIAKDERGQIRFVNDFDMSEVMRFYIIKNADTSIIRGWRAHRIEQRWFYVLSGSFEFNILKIDNWDLPSSNLPIEKFILKENDQQVIHIPAGYGTAFKAFEENSELLVFADYAIDHAKEDDYSWDISYFANLALI